ncbi:MAG: class I adenylate-forming enzyme family protein [Acidobacteriota bacterium]
MGPLLDAFDRWRRDQPARPALWSRGEGRRLDFAALDAEVETWRRRLTAGAFDLGPHRPVALALANRVAQPALVLALWRLGVPVVSVDAAAPGVDRVALCRRLGVTRLLHVPRPVPMSSESEALPSTPLGDDIVLHAIDQHADGSPLEPVRPPDGTVLVKLTSGSTGVPGGACYDAASLHAGITQIAVGMEIGDDDRVLILLPLSHSYGFDNGVLSLVVVGTPLVLQPDCYPRQVLRAAAESDATVVPLVPPLVRSLGGVAWPDHRLRRMLCAGGMLHADAAASLHAAAGVPVHDFYGSSETGGICFESAPDEAAAAGTVGRPLPGVDVSLDDEGRVVVDSAANRIAAWREPARRDDRRVRTGDLGAFTPEGRLRLVGRSADILNIGCRKVPAAHVERALRGLDGVREAAVVGVPDPMRGDRVVAFLVADRWPIDVRGLGTGLAPREVHRVDALPFTQRGKLDRAALRRRVAGVVDATV